MKKSFLSILFFMFLINSGFSQVPISVNLNIGAGLPLSEFANQYKGGVSIGGGVFYKIPKSDFSITLSTSYTSFSYNEAHFNDLVLKNLGITTDDFTYKWKAEVIPLMLGARLKFPSGKLSPYITAEAGINFLRINDRFGGDTVKVGTTKPNVFYFNGIEKGSETGFGLAFGFGFEYEIYPRVNLDFNLKYNYTKATVTKTYTVYMTDAFKFTTSPLEKLTSFTVRGGLVVDL